MTKEERLEKQLNEQMNYYWARLNDTDDLWLYCQELINVIEVEKREKLWSK